MASVSATLLFSCLAVMWQIPTLTALPAGRINALVKLFQAPAHLNENTTQADDLQNKGMGIRAQLTAVDLSNQVDVFRLRRPGFQHVEGSLALESQRKPGFYLRYKNYKFYLEKAQPTGLYEKAATFLERHPVESRKDIIALELFNHPGWFVCHETHTPFTLKAETKSDMQSKDFHSECLFMTVAQKPTTRNKEPGSAAEDREKDAKKTQGVDALNALDALVHQNQTKNFTTAGGANPNTDTKVTNSSVQPGPQKPTLQAVRRGNFVSHQSEMQGKNNKAPAWFYASAPFIKGAYHPQQTGPRPKLTLQHGNGLYASHQTQFPVMNNKATASFYASAPFVKGFYHRQQTGARPKLNLHNGNGNFAAYRTEMPVKNSKAPGSIYASAPFVKGNIKASTTATIDTKNAGIRGDLKPPQQRSPTQQGHVNIAGVGQNKIQPLKTGGWGYPSYGNNVKLGSHGQQMRNYYTESTQRAFRPGQQQQQQRWPHPQVITGSAFPQPKFPQFIPINGNRQRFSGFHQQVQSSKYPLTISKHQNGKAFSAGLASGKQSHLERPAAFSVLPAARALGERPQFTKYRGFSKGSETPTDPKMRTETKDKCISLKFLNKIKRPIKLKSNIKKEGYLVTTDSFKLRTVFKHPKKHHQIIFYAHDAYHKDMEVLLNNNDAISVNPEFCDLPYKTIILSNKGQLSNRDIERIREKDELEAAMESAAYTASLARQHNSMTQWSPFGLCSISCGQGVQKRTRTCRQKKVCTGPLQETRACIEAPCPESSCVRTYDLMNRRGPCCSFPFVFRDTLYDACLLHSDGMRRWCAITPNYDKHKEWGFCADSGLHNSVPFEQPWSTPSQCPAECATRCSNGCSPPCCGRDFKSTPQIL